MLHYVSGANRTPDIEAFAYDLGRDIGVVATELREEQLALLEGLADSSVRVFIDSGAFGEVSVTRGALEYTSPIPREEWDRIMAVYTRVAYSLGQRLSVVAPDRVGDQAVTLSRMEAHAETLYGVTELGARVLVPVQRGDTAMYAFYREAAERLGYVPGEPLYVPAIPMKKDATPIHALRDFMRSAQPREAHLLGMGPKSRKLGAVLAAIREVSPHTLVTCDSNELRRTTGYTGGRGGGPRELTLSLMEVERELNAKLGPKLVEAFGVELMLCGASSEAGDRFSAMANATHLSPLVAYNTYVWPKASGRDPSRLRQVRKRLAIAIAFCERELGQLSLPL